MAAKSSWRMSGARPSDGSSMEELCLEHERAGGGEHLLLTARHLAGDLVLAVGERGEEGEAVLEPAPGGGLVFRQVGTGLQVLQHGELAERPAPFRAVHQAEPADLVGRQAVDALAGEAHGW